MAIGYKTFNMPHPCKYINTGVVTSDQKARSYQVHTTAITTIEQYSWNRFQNHFFPTIKTMTANQNPHRIKELEHLKCQTT